MKIEYAASGISIPERSIHKQRNQAKRNRKHEGLRVAVQNHLALIEKQGYMTDADRRSLEDATTELLAQAKTTNRH